VIQGIYTISQQASAAATRDRHQSNYMVLVIYDYIHITE